MRTFVALPLPERIRDGLAKIQEGIPAGRVVCADSLHLTLVFLGEQSDDTLQDLNDALASIRAPQFDLTVHGLGSFGGARGLRTLWAGVHPEPRLGELQAQVARAARKAGITLEHRRFTPHITLARFKDGFVEDPSFTRFVAAEAGFTLPTFPVRQFTLYASTLGRGGPTYEDLAHYPLV